MKNIELPLLTPTVIRTARLSHEGPHPQPPPPDGSFVASVKSQTPPASSGQPWQLQLDVGGRQLTVLSERPLPPGSMLVLTATNDEPPLLEVKAIQLPAEKPSSLLLNTPRTLEQQLQAAALQLRQSPAIPVAVRELLAARLPLYSQPLSGTASTAPNAAAGPQAPLSPGTPSASGVQNPGAVTGGQSAGGSAAVSSSPSLLSLLQPQSANRKVGAYNEMAAYRPPQAGTVSNGSNLQQSPLPAPVAGHGADRLLSLLAQTQAALPTDIRQQLQSFISRLPARSELSQPAVLQQALQNNPLNFEKQAMQLVMSKLTPPAEQGSSDGLSRAFRHFWQGATGAAPAAKMNNSTLQSVISQLAAAASRPATDATSVHGLPGTLPLHHELPDGLKDNLKGLLLLISRHLPHPATGAVAGAAAGAAQADTQSLPLAETFRLLHSVLARTEQDQVRLLQQPDPYPVTIPLLFRDGSETRQISIDIDRDSSADNEPEKKKRMRWHLTLHFELDQLGPLDVELELMAPGVSARFWPETTDTLGLLNTSLQPLRQRLTALGAEVGELEVRHGRKLPEDQQLSIRHSLVDVRT